MGFASNGLTTAIGAFELVVLLADASFDINSNFGWAGRPDGPKWKPTEWKGVTSRLLLDGSGGGDGTSSGGASGSSKFWSLKRAIEAGSVFLIAGHGDGDTAQMFCRGDEAEPAYRLGWRRFWLAEGPVEYGVHRLE